MERCRMPGASKLAIFARASQKSAMEAVGLAISASAPGCLVW